MKVQFLYLYLLSTITLATCPEWSTVDVKKNIHKMQSEIEYHDDLYFNKHKTIISDAEYDQIKNHLTTLQNCVSGLKLKTLQNEKRTQKEEIQATMGSLNKALNEKNVQTFITKANNEIILLQPKIDGIAIEIIYNKGRLQLASTRGNGKQGVNILTQVRMIPAIPHHISHKNRIIIHGELFARLDKLNKNLDGYTSARHFVAGHISRSITDKNAMIALDFFPWLWVNSPYPSDLQTISALSKEGLPWASKYTYEVSSLNKIKKLRHELLHSQKTLPFLLDGIVIKLNNTEMRKKWGATHIAPNWALAWKFPAQTAITKISSINFNIGRSGNITPILNLETVKIGKQQISSISLGSMEAFHKKSISIGDDIVIQLQGQATPTFKKTLIHSLEQRLPEIPDATLYNGFSCLYLGIDCEQQFFSRLHWLVGKNGLNLPYLNRTILKHLIKEGLISSLYHIFTLNNDDLAKAGIPAPKINILQTALTMACSIPFEKRIKAISIPGIGSLRTSMIIQHYSDFTTLRNTTSDKLSHAIKSSSAFSTTVLKFLNHYEVKRLIDKLSPTNSYDSCDTTK